MLYNRSDTLNESSTQAFGLRRGGRHFVTWAFMSQVERHALDRVSLYCSAAFSLRGPTVMPCIASNVMKSMSPFSCRGLVLHSPMSKACDALSSVSKFGNAHLNGEDMDQSIGMRQSTPDHVEPPTTNDAAVGRLKEDRYLPYVDRATPLSHDARKLLTHQQRLDNEHATVHHREDSCETRKGQSPPGQCVGRGHGEVAERENISSFQAFFSQGRKRWMSPNTVTALQPRSNISETPGRVRSIQNMNASDAIGRCTDKELLQLLRQEADGLPKELFEAFPRKETRVQRRRRRREAVAEFGSKLLSMLDSKTDDYQEFEMDFSDVQAGGVQ